MHGRRVKRRSHRRPVGTDERDSFIRLLEDEAAADLTFRLEWLTSAGEHASPVRVRYRATESPSILEGDEHPAELTVERLVGSLKRVGTVALLGEGGSGKSTLLRLLQVEMLRRSKTATSEPVPVVLTLSTWSDDDADFVDWFTLGIDHLYRIPQGVAESMLADGRLTLLLDGFDELSQELREKALHGLERSIERFAGGLVIASRPAMYASTPPKPPLRIHYRLLPLDTTTLPEVLATVMPQASHDDALASFATTPLRLKMAVTVLALHHDVDSDDHPETGDPLTSLVSSYVRQRLNDVSREDHGSPFTNDEKAAVGWIANRMRDDGQAVLDPKSIPYSWGPKHIQRKVTVFAPLLIGVVGGLVALTWIPPILAGSIAALIWLSFTTDTNYWFSRDPLVVGTASSAAALSAAGLLITLPWWSLLSAVAVLSLWIVFSTHYAPRYVLAATLANAIAAEGAQVAAGLFSNHILVGLVSTVTWALVLVLALTVLFIMCGRSLKHHASIEGPEIPLPAWVIGMVTGADLARLAAMLGFIPVLLVTIVCSMVGLNVGTGIVAVGSPLCALFMVHVGVVLRARIVDHELPASLRLPLRISIVLAPLVILLGDHQKAILALPLMIALYLALNFIRGSDAGFFRTSEGGSVLRQFVYRSLLSQAHILPLRLERSLDQATRRLLMRRTAAGLYEFEHSLIRDNLADSYRSDTPIAAPTDQMARLT